VSHVKDMDDEQEIDIGCDFENSLQEKYEIFLSELSSDERLQYKSDNENVAFISILEKLPFITDPVDSDVRYESLIKKLVFHIRENIKVVNNQKRLNARVTKTTRWIIRAFRCVNSYKLTCILPFN
jgi:hypothetical protein